MKRSLACYFGVLHVGLIMFRVSAYSCLYAFIDKIGDGFDMTPLLIKAPKRKSHSMHATENNTQ